MNKDKIYTKTKVLQHFAYHFPFFTVICCPVVFFFDLLGSYTSSLSYKSIPMDTSHNSFEPNLKSARLSDLYQKI